MTNPVAVVLERYLDEISKVDNTVASKAKALGISIGTYSQIHNGKMEITDAVIKKIAKKVAGGEARRNEIIEELKNARSSTPSMPSALEAFDRFIETSPEVKRLVCFIYHDMPESTDQGRYPQYVNKVADRIRRGLTCAFFQPFGPVEEINKRAFEASSKGKFEISDRWTYIRQLAFNVRQVFKKTRDAVEKAGTGKIKGQLVLYEAANVPSLVNCHIHSRLFYSYQKSEINEIRTAQLIKGQEVGQEYFIEGSNEQSFRNGFTTQIYPVVNYWIEKEKLPIEKDENKLKEFYGEDENAGYWKILNDIKDTK